MRYALTLVDNNRIHSVTFEQYAAPLDPIVDELPEGDVPAYRFENGEYIHDPLPTHEPPEPGVTVDDILNALLGVE